MNGTDGTKFSGVLKSFQIYGTLVCFAGLMLFFWYMLPGTFMTGRNLINIAQQMSMLAVAALAMTFVMAMGDYDLSVGSMASLSGIVAAVVFRETDSVLLCLFCGLAVGLIGGAFNGFLVSYVGILPFVATLGTLTIFGGLAFLISDGKTIFGGDIPASFAGFARGGIPIWSNGEQTLLLPNLIIVALVMLLVSWFILHKLVFGRHLYAMGGSSEAARLAGVKVQATRVAGFCFAGVGAAIAGLMYMARVASASPIQGNGLMLDAFAAVFLGMTIGKNHEPRVLNSCASVLMIGVLSNGLTQLSVNSYVRDVLVGSIILGAVALSSFEKLRRN